jgi:peptidoglycan/LPS O-acetylase OafA/YrhL
MVAAQGGKYRLHFLDGLRAIASVYVLLSHVVSLRNVGSGDLSPVMRFVRACLLRGHVSVVFFIVLSGFSLMLPVARTDSKTVPSLRHYFYRRARRILPPYYAALALSIALIVGLNTLGPRIGFGHPVEGALSAGTVISHLLLVHNVSADWAFRLNMPMWSVATEWQIYFVFPFLLLPLLARTNAIVMVVFAWTLGSLPSWLWHNNFYFACPWLVGSFALGMWGALIGFSPAYRDSWLFQRAPWGAAAIFLFLVMLTLMISGVDYVWPYPLVDLVTSLFAFCCMNAGVRGTLAGYEKTNFLLRILSSRLLVFVSGFSYSLYLIQHPVLRLTERLSSKLPLTFNANMRLHLVLVAPAVMAVAWLFAEAFEKPFTTGTGLFMPRAKLAATLESVPESRV